MKKSDLQKFTKLMGVLCEIYDKECTEIKINIYFGVLKEYTIDQLSNAYTKIIKNRVYSSFPKPSEIIAEIADKVNIEDIALHQWITVKETLERVGTYNAVKFDDPLIHIVINSIGGWIELGQTETDQLQWKEKEFIRNYCLLSKQQSEDIDYPIYLPGIHSNSYLNQKYGHEVKIDEIKTSYPKTIRVEQKPKDIIKKLATNRYKIKSSARDQLAEQKAAV